MVVRHGSMQRLLSEKPQFREERRATDDGCTDGQPRHDNSSAV